MVRIAVAAILCLFATACGASEPFFPSGGVVRTGTDEFVSLGLAGLVAALATYALFRGADRSPGAEPTTGRVLRAVLVFCIALLGVLVAANGVLSTSGPTTRGVSSSVVAFGWGAMLLLHFRAVRRTARLGVLARVGPLLVVAPMPFFLFAVWIDGDPLVWSIGHALAIIATLCAHMTFVAGFPLRVGHRWLVVTTLVGAVSSAVAASLQNWRVLRKDVFGSCLQVAFPVTIAGTILVILCRRRNPRPNVTVASEPVQPER